MPRPKPSPTNNRYWAIFTTGAFTASGLVVQPSRADLFIAIPTQAGPRSASIDVTYPLLPFWPLVCVFRQGDGSSRLGSGTRPSCMPSISSGFPPVRLVPCLPPAFFGYTPEFQGKGSNVTEELWYCEGGGYVLCGGGFLYVIMLWIYLSMPRSRSHPLILPRPLPQIGFFRGRWNHVVSKLLSTWQDWTRDLTAMASPRGTMVPLEPSAPWPPVLTTSLSSKTLFIEAVGWLLHSRATAAKQQRAVQSVVAMKDLEE